MIEKTKLDDYAEKIAALVAEYGHPDNINMQKIWDVFGEQLGNELACLLTDEIYPADPAMATAKWMRKIGEFAQ